MGNKRKDKAKNKNDKNNTGNSECKKMTQRFNICALVLPVVLAIFAISSYKIYFTLLAIPDMPDIDVDVWWGSNISGLQDTSVRPYRVTFTDSMLENIRRKFEYYRSRTNKKSLNESSGHGLNSDAYAQLTAHWLFKYNYRHRARYFNKFEHFKTNIQGLDVHFVRVKPTVGPDIKVLPILLLHGFPTSIKEFYEVIPLLTSKSTAREYGFAFEVIAPSLPGFIFSEASGKPGLSLYQMAIIMRNLMRRLGFNKFYVHGGDIGHVVASHMATIFPDEILGFHTSFPVNFSKLANFVWLITSFWENMFGSDSEKIYSLKEKLEFYLEESGYLHLQSTKPDTIGIALQDSPAGLGAYIIDRIVTLTDPSNKDTPDSGLSSYNTTDLIDNVMLYWSSGSITTAVRVFKEIVRNFDTEETLARIPTTVPTWGVRVKNEVIHQSDLILSWKYNTLTGSTALSVGGHFAAFERPAEVASDIFEAVKSFIAKNEQ